MTVPALSFPYRVPDGLYSTTAANTQANHLQRLAQVVAPKAGYAHEERKKEGPV